MSDRNKARAPYNFVPLPDKPVYVEDNKLPEHDVYCADRHTGYFDVQLTTETPLFVRGMQHVGSMGDSRTHEKAFNLNGRPAIPGSSLRGMLRTLVEIVTHSKMHFVSDNKLVYRSVYGNDTLAEEYRNTITEKTGDKEFRYPSMQMHGGYLQRGDSESGWVIQPAKSHYGEGIALVKRQDVLNAGIPEKSVLKTYYVGIRPSTTRTEHTGKQGVKLHIPLAKGISQQANNGHEPATLIISKTVGPIGGKGSNRTWYPAIYEADPSAEPIPIPRRIWNDFVKDRDLNRGIENRAIRNPGDVLFYLLNDDGELLFFGPTMFFRLPYEHSIGDLIPEALRQDNPNIDYVEAMFGYVSEGSTSRSPSAYAGRVSVTSAQALDGQDDYYDETIIPKILSSPKPTTFQHYLEQPDGWRTRSDNLRHYGSKRAKIRGYKLYWRQMIESLQAVKDSKVSTLDGSSQHTIMRPVRKGLSFRFRVYFENLSDVELGALAWVLTLGGDPEARHQLGMGKPFGLGVVKLSPSLVVTDREKRYHRLFNADGIWHLPDKDAADYILAFKEAFASQVIDIDTSERIQQLRAMLRTYASAPDFFSYMNIEPTNEYKDQPVLPQPLEVEDSYKRKVAQLKRERKEQIGFEVGEEIKGDVFDNEDGISFTPNKRYGNKEYEGYIPPAKVVKSRRVGSKVKARIIKIVDGDPVQLICEQIPQ